MKKVLKVIGIVLLTLALMVLAPVIGVGLLMCMPFLGYACIVLGPGIVIGVVIAKAIKKKGE